MPGSSCTFLISLKSSASFSAKGSLMPREGPEGCPCLLGHTPVLGHFSRQGFEIYTTIIFLFYFEAEIFCEFIKMNYDSSHKFYLIDTLISPSILRVNFVKDTGDKKVYHNYTLAFST